MIEISKLGLPRRFAARRDGRPPQATLGENNPFFPASRARVGLCESLGVDNCRNCLLVQRRWAL